LGDAKFLLAEPLELKSPLTTGARATSAGSSGRWQLTVVAFEVNDQYPEDLAAGLDHIRALHGLFDVPSLPLSVKRAELAADV
jgi:pyridinium-3,5-bisthiocarboxylic acid mononucleotide nickel chelatase